MTVSGESGSRAEQARAKVQEMKQAAERTTDPAERQRLKNEARRFEEQTKQEGERGSGDVDPM